MKKFYVLLLLVMSWGVIQSQTCFPETHTISSDGARCVDLGDVNNDESIDVVVGKSDEICYFKNLNSGSDFQYRRIGNANDARSVHVGEFSGDDCKDVMVSDYGEGVLYYYANKYSGFPGWFHTRMNLWPEPGAQCNFAIDFDGDNRPDVVSGSDALNRVSVAYRSPGGPVFFDSTVLTTNAQGIYDVYGADLDGDGYNDVISASLDDGKIAWYKYLGNHNLDFDTARIITTNGATSVCAVDLDGDGDNDIISASFNNNKVSWFENLGNGNFSSEKLITSSIQNPIFVRAADLTGDNLPDLVVCTAVNKIYWIKNNGSGLPHSPKSIFTFTVNLLDDISSMPWQVAIGDIDEDGDNDIVSVSASGVAWYENYTLELLEQPEDIMGCPEEEAIFTVKVKDAEFYNWYVSTDGGATFSKLHDNYIYSGTNTDTLRINVDNSMEGYKYFCKFGNSAGVSQSDIATLTIDTIQPKLFLKSNYIVYLNENGVHTLRPYEVISQLWDNCSIADTSIISGKTKYKCEDVGSNFAITVTASDFAGNSVLQTTTVYVKDSLAPTIRLTKNELYLDSSGTASITQNDFIISITDNCAVADTSIYGQFQFDCSDLSDTNIIKVVAKDIYGNIDSSKTFITVHDTIKPFLATKISTVYLDNSGTVLLNKADLIDSLWDNCHIVDTTFQPEILDCSNLDTNVILVSITDVAGNTTKKQAIVIVKDTTAPILQTGTFYLSLDSTGNLDVFPSDVITSASDNCQIADTIFPDTHFNCSDIGRHTIEITLTDEVGNTTAKTAEVFVVDSIPPEIQTKDTVFYVDENGNLTVTPSDIIISITDNCPIANTSLSQTYFTCSDVGIDTIIIYTTDTLNNITENYTQIVISDSILPSIQCIDTILYVDTSENAYVVTGNNLDAIAFDNCEDNLLIRNSLTDTNTLDGANLNIGNNLITWQVFDPANNTVQCLQLIIIEQVADINKISSNVIVYPNPAENSIKIKTPYNENFEIFIQNTDGKTLLYEQTNNNQEINIANLPEGLYFLKIKTQSNIWYKKFVVVR